MGVRVKQHTESPRRLTKRPVFNRDALTVTIHAPIYRGAHVIRRFDEFKDTNGKVPNVVQEVFDGLVEVAKFSDWNSSETIRGAVREAVAVCRVLVDDEVSSVADLDLARLVTVAPRVAIPTVKTRRLLAYSLEAIERPELRPIAEALINHPAEVRDSETIEPYTEDEVAVIRQVAWDIVDETYQLHESYTKGLIDWLPEGTSVAHRDWWSIPADVIIAAATDRAKRGQRATQLRRQRSVASLTRSAVTMNLREGYMTLDEAIDWLLINPAQFDRSAWQAQVFFQREVMQAALIHHCFIDLQGFNLSTMQNTGVESLTALGPEMSMVDTIKPRAHLHGREASLTASRENDLAGFLGMVEALTKFSRHFRNQAGHPAEVADLYYANHDPNGTVKNVIGEVNTDSINRRIRSALADDGLDGERFTLSFKKLRLAAKREGMEHDPRHQLHGQNRRTATTYDKKMLPVTVLHDSMDKSVDEIIEEGWDRLADAVEKDTLADMTVSACTSGGADPQDEAARCEQGITACFACPNGVRTLDHIPGLIAMAEVLEDTDDPLRQVVTEVLDHAPQDAVDDWRERFSNDPSLANTWTSLASVTLTRRSRQ